MIDGLRAEVFFGATIPGNGAKIFVGDNSFHNFLQRNMTGFPGYTVTQGRGYWQGGQELTRVLTLYGPNSASFLAEVRKVADAYRAEFDQDAVLVGVTHANYALVEKREEESDGA